MNKWWKQTVFYEIYMPSLNLKLKIYTCCFRINENRLKAMGL